MDKQDLKLIESSFPDIKSIPKWQINTLAEIVLIAVEQFYVFGGNHNGNSLCKK